MMVTAGRSAPLFGDDQEFELLSGSEVAAAKSLPAMAAPADDDVIPMEVDDPVDMPAKEQDDWVREFRFSAR